MGLPRTLNEALEYVAGKYVSLMSTDDIMMPRKIEEQTKIFESGPDDVGIVFSKSYFMDENGESLAYEPGEKWQNQYHEGYVLEHLLERNFIIAPSMLVRRSCYDRVGGYDTSLVYEDYDMNLRIAEFYQFRYSDYVSARYRVHGNSMARSRSKKVQHSKIQIYFKWLERKPELKELLEARITAMAKDLYEARHPRRNYFLWKAFVQSYRLSSLLMCAYSFLDIPYSCYDASMRAWGGFADFRRGRI